MNKYTYDIYNRQATRSFDTDAAKQGYERVETYHYNSLNQLVRTNNDILGQGGEIDGYILREKDVYGRDLKTQSYNNDKLTDQRKFEYDSYGYQTKRVALDEKGNPSQTVSTKHDAYGRWIEVNVDRNNNGIWDSGDSIQRLHRDTDVDGTPIGRTDIYPDGREIYSKWTNDEFGRRIATHQDTNKDGVIDADEINWTISYIGQTGMMNEVNEYRGTTLLGSQKVHHDNNNTPIAVFRSGGDKLYTALNYNGYDNPRSSKEDFTESQYNELFNQYGGNLKTVNMTGSNLTTEITLDNDVLAKLSSQVKPTTVAGDTTASLVLTINGDATDKVNLKDYNEFTKASGTVQVGSNHYDKLTTEVEGKAYTLLVDTDIKLFDAANPGVEII